VARAREDVGSIVVGAAGGHRVGCPIMHQKFEVDRPNMIYALLHVAKPPTNTAVLPNW
jgi:hypothetical protein